MVFLWRGEIAGSCRDAVVGWSFWGPASVRRHYCMFANLVVFKRSTVVEFFRKMRCHSCDRGAPGQGDGERLRQRGRVGAPRRVLRHHPELVAPSRLQARHRHRGLVNGLWRRANPVRRSGSPMRYDITCKRKHRRLRKFLQTDLRDLLFIWPNVT